nr:hypothetical protein CFP56_69998 [Quercus suber]
MPARSTGCFICRKRKILCDGGRPACRRCIIHGVECSGYATTGAGSLEFRDQTAWIVRRAKKQLRPNIAEIVDRATGGDQATFSPTITAIESDVKFVEPSTKPATQAVVLSKSNKYQEQNVILQEDDFTTELTSTQTITSASVMRSQLYAGFLSIYLPKHVAMDHFAFLLSLGSRSVSNKALVEATDALSLVTIGTAMCDDLLVKEAVLSYGKSLGRLACALRRQNARHDDETLAAITILAQCEFYDEIRNPTRTGWGSHVDGTQQLIGARGPESLTSDFALTIFSNLRHGALSKALIERRAPLIANPAWRKVLRTKSPADEATEFYDAALQIPGLLETFDRFNFSSRGALDALDAILWRLDQIEQRLRSWYSGWQAAVMLREGSELYMPAPIDDFRTFAGLCTERTFLSAFMFHTYRHAYLTACYWHCMHALRTTVQSLLATRIVLDDGWTPSPQQIVEERELLEYVTNLCRTIPYFCEPVCASSGQIGIFLPLRVAAVYAKEYGHWSLLKWVGAVRASVFVKGMSPPTPSSVYIHAASSSAS